MIPAVTIKWMLRDSSRQWTHARVKDTQRGENKGHDKDQARNTYILEREGQEGGERDRQTKTDRQIDRDSQRQTVTKRLRQRQGE